MRRNVAAQSRAVPTAPVSADVVVRPETRDGKAVFVLHTVGGDDQYLVRTREEAVRQAVTFAKLHGLRAWMTGDDYPQLNDEGVESAWAPHSHRERALPGSE